MKTTKEVMEAMRVKFSGRADYAYLEQVRNQTGFARNVRTADALALQLYPSRGIYLEGFEVKVSRGDWLSELKKPQKAEDIAQYCDKWWVVAGDKSIVDITEMPENWGLMVIEGSRVIIKKQAPILEAKPMDILMFAGIMRNVAENYVNRNSIFAQLEEQRKLAEDGFKRSHKYEIEECEKLKQEIVDFEKISGVKINDWYLGDVAQAVKLITQGKHLQVVKDLYRLQTAISEAINIYENPKGLTNEQ